VSAVKDPSAEAELSEECLECVAVEVVGVIMLVGVYGGGASPSGACASCVRRLVSPPSFPVLVYAGGSRSPFLGSAEASELIWQNGQ
jgi:hypothetical protein